MTAPTAPADPCDVCGASDRFRPWLQVGLGGVYDRWVHRCDTCGFRQVRPRLTSRELSALYPEGYFDASADVGYGDYSREAQRRARDAYFLMSRLPPRRPFRVLEVGCALGFLLAPLRDAGLDVAGVDASPFAAYYASTRYGLDVVTGTLEDAAWPDASFDLVIQKDLLEHVSHPRRHLLETHRILRPGGAVWLITPNGEANLRPLLTVARTDGDGPLPLLDQGHLSFFDARHLDTLFAACGFQCERARGIGVRRGLRALGCLPGQRRFARTVAPVGAPAPTGPERDPGDDDVDRFEPLAARIDAEIVRRHSGLREWAPYRHYHRLMKRLDSLPVGLGVAYDFEFWLRKGDVDPDRAKMEK